MLICQDWPGIEEYDRVITARSHPRYGPTALELNHEQMQNLRRSVDWEEFWLRKYDPNRPTWEYQARERFGTGNFHE